MVVAGWGGGGAVERRVGAHSTEFPTRLMKMCNSGNSHTALNRLKATELYSLQGELYSM